MADRWPSSQRLVHLLGGRRTLAVLGELAVLPSQGRRYRDLHDALDGIPHQSASSPSGRAQAVNISGAKLTGRTLLVSASAPAIAA